jgi:hypothetical protein
MKEARDFREVMKTIMEGKGDLHTTMVTLIDTNALTVEIRGVHEQASMSDMWSRNGVA